MIFNPKQNSNVSPINATVAFNGMSDKYKFQSSSRLIDFIESNGFRHSATSFGRVKNVAKVGKQKHVMIFQHNDFKIDDENKLQLLVTNSHCGDSSVVFNLGLFRTVCANGLVVGDSFFQHSVKHVGSEFYNNIACSLEYILDSYGVIIDRVNTMRSTLITPDQRDALYNAVERKLLSNITNLHSVTSGIRAKRVIDRDGNDLFTALNIAQENAIRGGIQYKTTKEIDGITTINNNTTRAIKSIDKSSKINKFVWSEATKLIAA